MTDTSDSSTLRDWMREPDWTTDRVNSAWIAEWVNRRPIAEMERLLAVVNRAQAPDPQDAGKIATALGLFASCIKSGENWSSTCEQAKIDAFEALHRLTSGKGQ